MHKRGFTLTELLVVIAIIGILASLVVATVTIGQRKSRDARRLADVAEIQRALALYATSSFYPISAVASTTFTGSDAVSVILRNAGTINAVPADPVPSTYSYTYRTNATGNQYWISFCQEGSWNRPYVAGCSNTVTQ